MQPDTLRQYAAHAEIVAALEWDRFIMSGKSDIGAKVSSYKYTGKAALARQERLDKLRLIGTKIRARA